MLTKKPLLSAWPYLLLAVPPFLLITCTPLYELIFRPATITVRGTVLPGMQIKAYTLCYTKSTLCQDYSLSQAKFTVDILDHSNVTTNAAADGRFELKAPVERKSLWCDWDSGLSSLKVSPPPAKNDWGPSSITIGEIREDGAATSAPVTIQCAQTYYVFSRANDTTGKEERILCRNMNLPFPENASYLRPDPEIHIPRGAKELTVHLLMETTGPIPVYDLDKGPANFWREFDAARSAAPAPADESR